MTEGEQICQAGARAYPWTFAQYMVGAHELPALHRDLHYHIEDHPDCSIELPRGHGKTTEVGIGELHALAKSGIERPDLPLPRLKVVVANDNEAKKSGRFLRAMIDSDVWRWTFPEIVPDPEWDNMTDFRLINRAAKGGAQTPLRDPTVEVRAINGRPGGRWDRIWFDDICDLQNSIIKPALRDQVSAAADNTWMPMRDKASPHPKRSIRTYTPWHQDDKGMRWSRYFNELGALFRRPVIDFVSPWSEAFDIEYMRATREEIGPTAYARAYELAPASDDQLVFRPEWLMRSAYRALPGHLASVSETIISIDFAYTEKRATKPDPDWSVCIVAKIDDRGHVWIIDVLRMRASYPDFIREVRSLVGRCGASRGLGEAVGGQIGLVQQATRELGIPLKPITRVTDKYTRAVAGQPQVERGELHLKLNANGDAIAPEQQSVFEEMAGFPVASHDDCVDCVVDLLDEARLSRPRSFRPAPGRVQSSVANWSIPSRVPEVFSMRGPQW